MKINFSDSGKRFSREWIFRNLNFEIPSFSKCVLTGGNGSGKSTLLQIISGVNSLSEGKIFLSVNNKEILQEDVYHFLSMTAPYLELIEEFTLQEIFSFHFKFKKTLNNISVEEIIGITGLGDHLKKDFRFFSSGMKQRIKLALAIFTESSLLLLDEPVNNLDSKGLEWYHSMIEKYTSSRTVIVASNNVKEEAFFCTSEIQLESFKKR